jgi:REP element-mobilizing transposase RayT
MTAPRQVLPGQSYLITRRCILRQYLLRPSAATNANFLYVLAVAARRHGIEVHAYCVLSNHYHLVVTDPEARLPAFLQFLNEFVARAVNASLGRREAFWDRRSYSAVLLASPSDIVAKTAYVLANPVAAGLVRCARDWPGLWSGVSQGRATALAAPRPRKFFREGGPMPARATMVLSTPTGFSSAAEFSAAVSSAVAELEARHVARVRTFRGAARVLAQNPHASPGGREAWRELQPRVAAADPGLRVRLLRRLRAFLAEYRCAWLAWCAGARGAIFPAGTYAMRVVHRAACCASG